MPTVEIANLGTFDVHLWSKGSGAPLLYLHGYERHPGDAGFLRRMGEKRRVFAPEHPGYGSSTGEELFRDVVDVAFYYRQFVDACDVDEIDVVGHSLGGMFAAELAAVAPHLVRRLVLVDAFGLWLDDEPAPDPFGPRESVQAAAWHGAPPEREPTNFTPDPNNPQAAVLFAARNLGTATKFMWPIADRGLRRRLPYVTARTLVVHGSSDGLVPLSYAEEFVRLLPRAELAVIDGAGHYPMVEQEDRFVAVVEEFLGR